MQVIPSVMAGSGIAGALSMLFGRSLSVLHGGLENKITTLDNLRCRGQYTLAKKE